MVEVLIWSAGIFFVGGVLVLERHCLGQRALVQPLSLCLVAGLLSNHVETGIWLGVTLQLLSLSPTRSVDWALSSAVASVLLVVVPIKLDIPVVSGDLDSALIAFVAVMGGVVSRRVEGWYAKTDWGKIQGRPPWQEPDPVKAMERTVYRAILRWLAVGGIEVSLGVGLGLAAMIGAQSFGPTPEWLTTACATALPTFGVAVVASALVEYRFIAWSGISMGFSMLLLTVVFR